MQIIRINTGMGRIILANTKRARRLVADLGVLKILEEHYKNSGAGDYTKILCPADLSVEFADVEYYHGSIKDYRQEQADKPRPRIELVQELEAKDEEIASLRQQLDETRLPLAEAAE